MIMFKDSTISAAAKRREVIIFAIAFAIGFIMNVIGIIQHKTPAVELFTQLHVVLLIALLLYGLVAVLRIFYHLVMQLWNRKKQ